MSKNRWKAVVGGLGLVVWAAGPDAYEAWRGDQTVGWPRVEATVVSHGIALAWPWEAGWWRHRRAEVTYRYRVEGVEYECCRVRYQQPSDGRRASDSLSYARSTFPVGASVEARYDPSSPSRAVLVAAAGDWGMVWRQGGIMAAVMAAFAVGHVVWVRVRD